MPKPDIKKRLAAELENKRRKVSILSRRLREARASLRMAINKIPSCLRRSVIS